MIARQEQRTEDIGADAVQFRQEWVEMIQLQLPVLILQCYSPEELDDQPPKHELILAFKFNYNYGTYMPLGPPIMAPFGKGHADSFDVYLKAYENTAEQKRSSTDRTHVIHLLFENQVGHFTVNIDKPSVMRTATDFGLDPTEFSFLIFVVLWQSSRSIPSFIVFQKIL
jgi:hypothetical protein